MRDELGVDIALVKLNPVKGITPAILNLSDSGHLEELYTAGLVTPETVLLGNNKENTCYAASNIWTV